MPPVSIPARFLDLFVRNLVHKMKHHIAHGFLAGGALVYVWVHVGSPWKAWAEHGWEVAAPLVWAFSLAVCFHSVISAKELISSLRSTASLPPAELESKVLTASYEHFRIPAVQKLVDLPRFYTAKVWSTAAVIIGLAALGSYSAYRFSKGEHLSEESLPGTALLVRYQPYNLPVSIEPHSVIYVVQLNPKIENWVWEEWNRGAKTVQWPSGIVKDNDDDSIYEAVITNRGTVDVTSLQIVFQTSFYTLKDIPIKATYNSNGTTTVTVDPPKGFGFYFITGTKLSPKAYVKDDLVKQFNHAVSIPVIESKNSVKVYLINQSKYIASFTFPNIATGLIGASSNRQRIALERPNVNALDTIPYNWLRPPSHHWKGVPDAP